VVDVGYGFPALHDFSIRINDLLGRQLLTIPVVEQRIFVDVTAFQSKGLLFINLTAPDGSVMESSRVVVE
jgi:hypothetical protein